ncbi:MAG: DNA topoisomerase [Faecalibacillus faecis]
MDRIIGFKLSKLLQRKIKSKSAGRVQSVALRLIVEKNVKSKPLFRRILENQSTI